MRFGLNTFLVSSAFSDDDRRLIGLFREWGADFIEMAVHEPAGLDANSLRRDLQAAGMDRGPVCGMFPPDRDLRGDSLQQQTSREYLLQLIDLAAALGSPVVAGPFYSSVGRCQLHTDEEKAQQLDMLCENLSVLCDHAEKSGVVLAMEPLNRFETDFVNTLEQATAIIRRVGSPALTIHADTFHMNIEESDSAAALREAGDLIGHVHASASHRGIPGRDQVRWYEVFAALRDIGYAGDIAIESFSMDNDTIARAASIWMQRFESAEQLSREGLTFLRKTWAEVEENTKQ